MLIRVCRTKIQNAKITGKTLQCYGSLKLDKKIMEKANLYENELVLVINIENGQRFETYLLPGDDGEVSLLGGAARLCEIGDRLIIMAFGYLNENEVIGFKSNIITLDENNKIK